MASLPTPGGSDVWGADLNAAIESLHLGPDTHANRPTTGLTTGTLYSCTDHSLIYRWNGSTWVTFATLGGGGGAETYEDAVTALPGKVHRWRFNEASGSNVADSIGSLPLTLSGTYTRGAAGFGGAVGTTFANTGKARNTSIGNIPAGSDDRCFLVRYKQTSTSAITPFSYGNGGTTRGWFNVILGASNDYSIQLQTYGDDVVIPKASVMGTEWTLACFGYDGNRTIYMKTGDTSSSYRLNGSLATVTPGPAGFTVGQQHDNSGEFLGTIDDFIVLDNWPGVHALDRVWAAFAAS